MLDLKVNKKLLQNHMSKTSGQVVLLKDLHNIAASSKDNKSSRIQEAVEELKKVPGNSYQSINRILNSNMLLILCPPYQPPHKALN